MTNPSSTTARPAALCPPPRTAMGRPCSRAKRTAATTSASVRTRAIAAGRRSIIPFQTRRASSYRPSSGRISTPLMSSVDQGSAENASSCGSITFSISFTSGRSPGRRQDGHGGQQHVSNLCRPSLRLNDLELRARVFLALRRKANCGTAPEALGRPRSAPAGGRSHTRSLHGGTTPVSNNGAPRNAAHPDMASIIPPAAAAHILRTV